MSYIVGVCGGSGSGKTTLANLLAEKLQGAGASAAVISHDNYYKHEPGMTPEQRAAYNFDVPEAFDSYLLAQDLRELKAGRATEIPLYDFSTQTRREETQRIEPADVIIVEGILIYADEGVRLSFDMTIYVDAPADIRLLRRFVRDIEERGHTPQSAAELYLNTARDAHAVYVEPYRATSDLVVNDVFDETMLEFLVAGLLAHRQQA